MTEPRPCRAPPGTPCRRPLGAAACALLWAAAPVQATVGAGAPGGPVVLGVPAEFVLFAVTLLGVAFLHRHTLAVALGGLALIIAFKLALTGFPAGPGLAGLAAHLHGEWVVLANLLGLLTGFALLARHFEDSRLPAVLPRVLPAGWPAGFVLLVMIFVLSGFLDNIAAALIGGTLAAGVFRHRIHIGYLAAIVAAANAGGSGSVVGDTTTTMMWFSGVGPGEVVLAYAVGFGASMIWFGSSAGVALASLHPPARSVVAWVRAGWHVALAYVAGFAVLLALLGWNPAGTEAHPAAAHGPPATEPRTP